MLHYFQLDDLMRIELAISGFNNICLILRSCNC